MLRLLSTYFLCCLIYFSTAQNQRSDQQQHLITITDSIIKRKMAELHIVGVSVNLIQKDAVFFSKGYSYANLAQKQSIQPHLSHFDMGSIPKSLTAVAILQLYEKGLLQLDAAIDQYLKELSFQYLNDKPITIHHLLTHTAGFEDISNIETASPKPEKVPSLLSFLKRKQPKQILEAGTTAIYSNYGYGLLGRIIENVSGQSFQNYMHENLLIPLEMTHSSFKSLLSEKLEVNRVLGYEVINGETQVAPINFQHNLPAAGLRATTTDLSNFGIMLLNLGKYKNRHIISKNSLQKILATNFRNHPQLPGLGYSLRELILNGKRAMAQNGGWQGFNNDIIFLPEANLGLVISCNTDDNQEISEAIWQGFMDYLYPKKAKALKTQQVNITPKLLQSYIGKYRSNTYSRSTLLKLGALLGFIPEYEISLQEDTLQINGYPLIPKDKDLFERSTGSYLLAFNRNKEGQIIRMFRSDDPYSSYERLSPMQDHSWKLYFLLLILVLLFCYLMASLIFLFQRKQKASNPNDEAWNFGKLIHRTLVTAILLSFLFLLTFAWAFSLQSFWDLQFGMTPAILFSLSIPIIILILFCLLSFGSVLVWAKKIWSFPRRVFFTIEILMLLLFLLFLNYWNLLGFYY